MSNFPDLHEEVYDNSSEIDPEDKCSLIDDGYWYENDLLLAAELGKTLLERNRDLEGQLAHHQKVTQDQQLEIDLLVKQLATLRELNESKMRIYEDVDRHSQELESANKLLEEEIQHLREKTQSLSIAKSSLESQLDDYKEMLRNLEIEKNDWLKCRQKQNSALKDKEFNVRRSNSLPHLLPFEFAIETPESFPVRLGRENFKEMTFHSVLSTRNSPLKGRVTDLTSKLKLETERNQELESELSRLQEMNQDLKLQLKDTERRLESLEADYCMKNSLMLSNSDEGYNMTPTMSPSSTKDPVHHDLFSNVEHDFEVSSGNPAEIGRLLSGGHIYSSQESLNLVGASPCHEVKPTNKDVSLLSELDQQYNKLVTEYEAIVKAKRETLASAPVPQFESSAVESVNLQSSAHFETRLGHIFSDETRRERKTMITQDYRPKYKELFKDAFNLLTEMKQQTGPVNRPRSRPTTRSNRLNRSATKQN